MKRIIPVVLLPLLCFSQVLAQKDRCYDPAHDLPGFACYHNSDHKNYDKKIASYTVTSSTGDEWEISCDFYGFPQTVKKGDQRLHTFRIYQENEIARILHFSGLKFDMEIGRVYEEGYTLVYNEIDARGEKPVKTTVEYQYTPFEESFGWVALPRHQFVTRNDEYVDDIVLYVDVLVDELGYKYETYTYEELSSGVSITGQPIGEFEVVEESYSLEGDLEYEEYDYGNLYEEKYPIEGGWIMGRYRHVDDLLKSGTVVVGKDKPEKPEPEEEEEYDAMAEYIKSLNIRPNIDVVEGDRYKFELEYDDNGLIKKNVVEFDGKKTTYKYKYTFRENNTTVNCTLSNSGVEEVKFYRVGQYNDLQYLKPEEGGKVKVEAFVDHPDLFAIELDTSTIVPLMLNPGDKIDVTYDAKSGRLTASGSDDMALLAKINNHALDLKLIIREDLIQQKLGEAITDKIKEDPNFLGHLFFVNYWNAQYVATYKELMTNLVARHPDNFKVIEMYNMVNR